MKTIIEPFRIKMVEPIRMTSELERTEILQRAGMNVFLIPAQEVLIDLLTDSGTSAMSSEQWAGIMRGDESYAGATSWYRFEKVMHEITGMPYILPTHQGRASERILFELIGGPGKVIPNNNHFDTTRANIEYSGAEAVDLVIDEAADPNNLHPFKGNLDLRKLENLITHYGPKAIPLCMITITNNRGGGQPVSLENIRKVHQVTKDYGIPLYLDACRFAENAAFIQQRESGYADRSIREIVKEIFSLAEGATISAKKDGLVNIGGVLLLRNESLAAKANNLLILSEGFVTYGGLAGRDLEAMAQGFQETLEKDYLLYRLRSIAYLGNHLTQIGIPIVQPTGGHAIYIDAKSFCAHIPPYQFPGQALVCALYRYAGIRAVEIGTLMFGQANETPESIPKERMELVRLAIPRRVYTQSHIDYVIEALGEIFAKRETLSGLKIVSAPSILRHFTARLQEITPTNPPRN